MKGLKIKAAILDFVYPPSCPICGKEAASPSYCCGECAGRLTPYAPTVENPAFGRLISAFVYDDVSKKLIYAAKEGNDGCAVSAMAYFMHRVLSEERLTYKISEITYVPMYRTDMRRRGYNQSRLLARELSALTGKPCRNLLKKVKATQAQKELGAVERRENIRGAFRYDGRHDAAGKTILLIDDVCTTGSTLSECALRLIEAGAENVFALVFAKTLEIKA